MDKSGTANHVAEVQWSVHPDASITTGAGGGAPVLGGELASTSELEATEMGESSEVPE